MCLLTTFSGPNSGETVDGNGRLGPALAFFDLVKNYPGAASRGNNGVALNPLVPRAFMEKHYFFSKLWRRIEGGKN